MHWYNNLGETCYDAGIRDARKLKLLPSVTTVDKMLANPGLEIWKQNMILDTCTEYPNDISQEAYKTFIKKEAFKESNKARKLGNVIHKFAERYISGKALFFKGQRQDVWEIFATVRDWIDANLQKPDTGFMNNEGAEVVLVNEVEGYAGKADFVGKDKEGFKVLLDFKTTALKETDIKKDGSLKKAKIYDSWIRQLAALQFTGTGAERLLSVVISTNPECLGVWVHEWDFDSMMKGWREFRNALALFKSIKGLE